MRIGVSLGEVVVADGTLTGAGVVLAQRLEQLARAGGVVVQGSVSETVPARLPFEFESLGEQSLKGFDQPVRAFVTLLQPGRLLPEPESTATAPAAIPGESRQHQQVELPDKPSIAVLPFHNLSGEPEQELFAEGMTEDLTTDLSKVSGIFVVSRASSLAYAGKGVDLQKAGQGLGVRYLLEGSVRKAADRVRINAQLVEAANGRQVWADRYDGSIADVFELQDAVGAEVVAALSVELTHGEKHRLARVHTQNLDAYELFIRAIATPYPPLPARIENAREMFERVISLDPGFAGGYAGVAAMLGFSAVFDHADPTARIERAFELANKAIETDETFGWSYTALAITLLNRGEHEQAMAAGRTAIECQPNDADAHAWLAFILGLAGDSLEGITTIDQAIRLNPLFVNGPYLNMRTMIQVIGARYQDAIESHEQNIRRGGPIGPPVLAFAAAALGAIGRTEDARSKTAQLMERVPDFRLSGWNLLALFRHADERKRVEDHMVASGVPR